MQPATPVGTFAVADGFFITGRGLVLLGKSSGQVASGQWLRFPDGTSWRVKAINLTGRGIPSELLGLLVEAPVSSRAELLGHSVIGFTAEIITS